LQHLSEKLFFYFSSNLSIKVNLSEKILSAFQPSSHPPTAIGDAKVEEGFGAARGV
jgi:hypothetical protein